MKNFIKAILFAMVLVTSMLVTSVSANEFQVFSSFTKKIEIDSNSNSNFKKIYYGKAEEFYKNPSKYLNEANIKQITTYSLQSITNGVNSLAAGGTGKGGLIGLAGIAIISIGEVGYNWIISDNEYIYLSLVTNTKGEQTLIYTLIVANSSIDDDEGESLALADQKKLIRKIK